MKRGLFIGICAWALVAGCHQRVDRPEGIFRPDDAEYVLTIVLDLSSSFQGLMAEDGKAWAFVCQVIDQYFRDRLGQSDKLILAQLSADDRALLWRGTPLELRNEFPSASAFRDWLTSHADPNGSRVYEGISQAVEYTLGDPVVASGNGKAAVFVLSDMIDNGPDGDKARDRALDALAQVGRNRGVVGLYYVDVRLCSRWRQLLVEAGVPLTHLRVEAEIVGCPLLPKFE